MKRALLFFLSLSFASIIEAQPTWQQCMTSIYRFKLAITTNGYVFGCGDNGTGMKMSTTGAPSSFVTVYNFPALGYLNGIVANGNLIFVNAHYYSPSYQGDGVWMTADFGATWVQKNNGLGPNTNVVRLAVLDSGVMLANTTDGWDFKTFRSADYGNSWTQIQDIYFMQSVNMRSATEAYMCAGTEFYKSVDNGLTWNIVSAISLSDLIVLSSGVFTATAPHAIMQSVDNGVTWDTLVATGLPAPAAMQSGSFIKTAGDTVFYANTTNPWGLYYSTDACATWTTCNTGFTSTPQLFRDELALSSNGYLFAGPGYGGTVRTTVPISYITTGVAENSFTGIIDVYPNPAADKITITSKEQGKFLYTIYNVAGKTVFSQQLPAEKAEIDLSGLAAGTYVLKISSGEKSMVRTIVRE
jgi:hypothetical protein